jgi:hypothetical protein
MSAVQTVSVKLSDHADALKYAKELETRGLQR